MVEAYSDLEGVHKPPLKLGHDDGQKLLQRDGYPAAGWIKNLRQEGANLYADILSVPKKIASLIRAKAYGRLSPEIYRNLRHGEKTYKSALAAVSLLGADIPANWTLKDFIDLYNFPESDYDDLITFQADKMPETNTAYSERELVQMEQKAAQLAEAEKELNSLKAEKAEIELNASSAKAEAEKLKRELDDLKAEQARRETENYSRRVEEVWSKNESRILPKNKPLFLALANAALKESYTHEDEKLSTGIDVLEKFCALIPEQLEPQTEQIDIYAMKSDGANSPEDRLHQKALKMQKESGGKMSYKEALLTVSEIGASA